MFDVNKLTLLVMNKYTPVYEDPNLADFLPQLSFGTMSGEAIEKATKQVFVGKEINVKDVAQSIIDEYKKSDNVALDRQSIGIAKTEAVVNVDDVNVESKIIIEETEVVNNNSKINVI